MANEIFTTEEEQAKAVYTVLGDAFVKHLDNTKGNSVDLKAVITGALTFAINVINMTADTIAGIYSPSAARLILANELMKKYDELLNREKDNK